MRKHFGGELCKQPGKIVVLFTISPGRQFEHPLAAGPQLPDITRRRSFRLPDTSLGPFEYKLTF